MVAGMRLLAFFILALLAELGSSWWTWVRSPTDSLRALYLGSFLDYEIERLVPWSVILIAITLIGLVLHRHKKVDRSAARTTEAS